MNPPALWAPSAQSVHLILNDQVRPLERQDDPAGWWILPGESVAAGTAYQFKIDNGPAIPDPRSAWQPEGPHGPSVTVDHAAFAWPDAESQFQPRPLADAVIYELHVGTFTDAGTYRSATEKLRHLRDLGVTHLELLPLATFPGERGWGYDGVSLFAPHPAYGSPDDLKHFIAAAHAEGIAVLLDVVYNHLGPDGNYLIACGPYFTDRHHTPWGTAVNLDEAHSEEVRAFFFDNAVMWLRDYHFDGLRLDAVHALIDRSAIHFLESLSDRVAELSAKTNRQRVLIAESDLNDPRFVRPATDGGFGLDAHWIDDFHHALHSALTGERDGYYADYGPLEALAKALRQAYVFDGNFSPHRLRRHGRPPTGVRRDQLVVCAQNHDQIGNRALGERLIHLTNLDVAKTAAALTILSPFVPMLFQGEEWGASAPFQYFTDHTDKNLGHAVTKGRRREFAAFKSHSKDIPDPQDRATFERSKLHWDELSAEPHASLLTWHRDLIRIRHEHLAANKNGPAIDAAEVNFDETARWISVLHGPLLILANLSDQAATIPLPEANWQTLLTSHPGLKPTSPLPPGATLIAR